MSLTPTASYPEHQSIPHVPRTELYWFPGTNTPWHMPAYASRACYYTSSSLQKPPSPLPISTNKNTAHSDWNIHTHTCTRTCTYAHTHTTLARIHTACNGCWCYKHAYKTSVCILEWRALTAMEAHILAIAPMLLVTVISEALARSARDASCRLSSCTM